MTPSDFVMSGIFHDKIGKYLVKSLDIHMINGDLDPKCHEYAQRLLTSYCTEFKYETIIIENILHDIIQSIPESISTHTNECDRLVVIMDCIRQVFFNKSQSKKRKIESIPLKMVNHKHHLRQVKKLSSKTVVSETTDVNSTFSHD